MQLHMLMQLCIRTLLSKQYYTLGAMIKRTKALYRVDRKKRSNFEAVLLINYTTEKLQIWMV